MQLSAHHNYILSLSYASTRKDFKVSNVLSQYYKYGHAGASQPLSYGHEINTIIRYSRLTIALNFLCLYYLWDYRKRFLTGVMHFPL